MDPPARLSPPCTASAPFTKRREVFLVISHVPANPKGEIRRAPALHRFTSIIFFFALLVVLPPVSHQKHELKKESEWEGVYRHLLHHPCSHAGCNRTHTFPSPLCSSARLKNTQQILHTSLTFFFFPSTLVVLLAQEMSFVVQPRH